MKVKKVGYRLFSFSKRLEQIILVSIRPLRLYTPHIRKDFSIILTAWSHNLFSLLGDWNEISVKTKLLKKTKENTFSLTLSPLCLQLPTGICKKSKYFVGKKYCMTPLQRLWWKLVVIIDFLLFTSLLWGNGARLSVWALKWQYSPFITLLYTLTTGK